MTKKEQIDNIASQLKDALNSNKELNEKYTKMYNMYIEQQGQLAQVPFQDVAQIPFNSLDIYSQNLLNEDIINTNMSIKVKQALGGVNDGASGGMFMLYLLILERARYFKSCVVFDSENYRLVKAMYQALYYGSLNGSVAIVREKGGYFLAYVTSRKYDRIGNLKECELQTFNYLNSNDFESETLKYKGDKINDVVIFNFNNENFGLWVLCWYYLEHIYEFFETLINQQLLMNKKFVFRGDIQNPNIRKQVVRAVTDKSVVIWLNKDLDLKELQSPTIDLGETFNLIENYTNYFDFHILGIRTKDISDSTKSRDIASQQLNHQTLADNKDQTIDFFVEDLIFQIREKWGEDVSFENRNITLSDDIKEKSVTINKLNSNGGENYD